jgi:microsomal epoxide hydrolase
LTDSLEKPFGFSSFAKEISAAPEAWASRNGNLQFYRYHPKVCFLPFLPSFFPFLTICFFFTTKGGHFAAGEQPEAFAQDMKDCFKKIWPA